MPVTDIAKPRSFTGNGTTAAFAVVDTPENLNDLEVWLEKASDGSVTRLVRNTDYAITGTASAGYQVDLTGLYGAPAANDILTIQRVQPPIQPTPLRDGSTFPTSAISAALDRLTRSIQDIAAKQKLSIARSPTEYQDDIDTFVVPAPSVRASTIMAFDQNGGFDFVSRTNVDIVAGLNDEITELSAPSVVAALQNLSPLEVVTALNNLKDLGPELAIFGDTDKVNAMVTVAGAETQGWLATVDGLQDELAAFALREDQVFAVGTDLENGPSGSVTIRVATALADPTSALMTAEQNATDAEAARDLAAEWASKPVAQGQVAATDYSAKAWARDDLRGAAGGSAKDWAVGEGVIDGGTEVSAKTHASTATTKATEAVAARDAAIVAENGAEADALIAASASGDFQTRYQPGPFANAAAAVAAGVGLNGLFVTSGGGLHRVTNTGSGTEASVAIQDLPTEMRDDLAGGIGDFDNGVIERGTPVRTHHIVESVEAAPPGSPAEGARYLVAASGTSSGFVGQENKIAVYVGAAWQYLPPAEGWTLYNKAVDRRSVYASSAWIAEDRAERADIEAVYRVEDYGTLVAASSGAAAGNVAAFNAAYAAAVADGGGVIRWPRGQYYVTNILAPGVLWTQDAAMRILADGITVEGSGDLDTELVLADDSDSYIFVIGRRGDASSSITGQAVHNCAVRNIKLDGNGPNQAPSTTTTDFENHWSAIEVAEGCTRITIEDLEITEPQYYGVGFQAGNGNTGCAVRRVRVIDAGADGIDCKNNDSTAKDNVLEDVYVENHGQQNVWHGFTSTSGPGGTNQRVVEDQAGINVRSGWRVVRPTVVKFRQNLATGEEGRVGIRLETDKTPTSGSNFNLIDGYRVSDVYIDGDSTVSNETVGITGSALHINVNGGVIRNCWRAIQNSQRENQYSNLDIFGGVDGVVLLTGQHTDADNVRLTNIDVRACTGRGFAFEAHPDYASNFLTGIECIGCNSRGNGTGVYLASIVQNMRWIGGSITSNTTANIDDDSAATVLNRFFFVEGISDSVLELMAGSFTPALGNANGDPVASYSVQQGRYSVVGSVLTVTGRIDCTIIAAGPSFDALTGDWYVEGLPLPAAALLGGCGIVGNITNIDLPATTIQAVGVVNPGTSQMLIRVDGDNVAPTTLNRFHMKAGTTIGFNFHVSYAVRS